MALLKTKAEVKGYEQQTVGQVFGHQVPPPAHGATATPVEVVYPDLLCGIELEIENLTLGHDFYVEEAGEFWSVEEDGSLRPRGQAWEFISFPHKMGQVLGETQQLFGRLGIDEVRNYSDRCSVHIHCNVIDWTQEQVASLALIYPVFEDVLFKYVNHHKKKEEQGYCRDTNLYCIPWSACRHNRNFVETLFTNPIGVRNWQKYTALNLLPILDKGTVEWRHLHGTCDMEKLTTWFNIIGAIMKYCRTTPFAQIVELLQKMNDVSTYQQWFTEVLQGQLPYDEEYRRLMAEGVLNAKYSLINWEANKGAKKAVKVSLDYETVEDFLIPAWGGPFPDAVEGRAAGTGRVEPTPPPAGANVAGIWGAAPDFNIAPALMNRDEAARRRRMIDEATQQFARAQEARRPAANPINPVNRTPRRPR